MDEQMLTRLDDPREVAYDDIAQKLFLAIEAVQGEPAEFTAPQEQRIDAVLRAVRDALGLTGPAPDWPAASTH